MFDPEEDYEDAAIIELRESERSWFDSLEREEREDTERYSD